MSEIEKNASNFLSSHSVNWQLGLDILEALVVSQGDKALARQVLHRVVELKPTLAKKFGTQDPVLNAIANRHVFIALDDVVRLGAYYKVPVIKEVGQLDLEIFAVLSSEIKLAETDWITPGAHVFGFGSCFAVNFINHLNRMGITASSSVLSEDINSPRNNCHLLDWVLNGRVNYISEQLPKLNPEFNPAEFLARLKSATHIVLTLGTVYFLARIGDDGAALPALIPGRGTVTVSPSFGELQKDIDEILKLLRQVNPGAVVMVTVSPVPLRGVMHKANPVVANMFSKSMLRAAIESFRGAGRFTYLPIYDAILGLAPHSDFAAFGKDDGECRHLNGLIIDSVMRQITSLIVRQPGGATNIAPTGNS